jgi:hypothetical protein
MADRLSLRIVSLNTWGGNALEPLLGFVRQQSEATDLFCLQEILNAPVDVPLACGFRTNLLNELRAVLPAFDVRFDVLVAWDQPRVDVADPIRVPFGLATFTRRTLPILDQRCEPLIKHDDSLDAVPGLHRTTRRLQLTRVRTPGGSLLVGNFHGMSRPGTKLDSAERLAQSRAIRRVMDQHSGPSVLMGDFNLLPETTSVRILEHGRRNLITDYRIATTRSRLNAFYGTPQEQPHANYTFATPDVQIASFAVPDVDVSDHLPMVMTINC